MNNLCPSCGTIYNVTAKNIGRRTICKKCGTGLVVNERGLEIVSPKPAPATPSGAAQAKVVPWQEGLKPPQPASSAGKFDFEETSPRHDDDVDDDDDDYDYSDRAIARRGPRWLVGFGAGCGLVKWGMWVNFAGIAYLILLFEISLLGKNLDLFLRPALYAPLYLLQLAGTGMMLLGWWRMTAVPPNSGASGLMTGASILAALRVTLLFVGTVLLIMAVAAKGLEGLKYVIHSYTALMIADICLWVATFSVIPGMAIVGGEIPSRRLRQKAGWVTLVHQILAIVLLSLVAAVWYLVLAEDFLGRVGGEGNGDRVVLPNPGRGGRPAKDVNPVPMMMFFLFAILLIQAAYTYLHYSLYAVGQQAAARGADAR